MLKRIASLVHVSRFSRSMIGSIAIVLIACFGDMTSAGAQQFQTSSSGSLAASDVRFLPQASSSIENTGSSPHPKLRTPTSSEKDISLGTFSQLTATRSASRDYSQYLQGTSPSAGVLGTFHQQFSPWLGYNVNFGYTRMTENYERDFGTAFAGSPIVAGNPIVTGSFSRGSIGTNTYELSAAYVAKGPSSGKHLQTFVQGGGGVLMLLPTDKPFQGFNSYRATVVFGAGVDYRLSDHLGFRAEYRGLFYKNPDFAAVISLVPVSKQFTVTNEPTVSLTYRFGARKK